MRNPPLCPRCAKSLSLEVIREREHTIEIDVCSQCKGMWFDKGELQPLEKISEPVLVEIRKIPGEWDQLTALNCPKCLPEQRMKKDVHPKDEKVIFDYCENCEGIWLDGGELAAIQKQNWFVAVFQLFKKLH